ncbi:ABC transporter permease [Pseudoalteromonas fenneropenaei]|uniref:ABC transporter permease n=1 Tax=Pseudoalteromonas fenneropenaei TaxID=1737459 RepID=A0ABV7CJT2_9GAMM
MTKYAKVCAMGMQNSLAYRSNYVVGLVAACFPMLLQWMLWQAIFNYTQAATLYGLSYPQMMSYVVLAALMTQALRSGFEYEIAEDIKSGGLNRFLVQPISYLGYRFCAFIGTHSGFFVITVVLMFVAYGIATHYWQLDSDWRSSMLFIPAVLNAFLLQFMLFYLLSLVAFWLQEVWGIFEAVRVISLVLSGAVVPLTVFPQPLQWWLSLLPFQYIVYFPLQVLNGLLSAPEILSGLAMQSFWLVVFYLISCKVWRMGCRDYVALGS